MAPHASTKRRGRIEQRCRVGMTDRGGSGQPADLYGEAGQRMAKRAPASGSPSSQILPTARNEAKVDGIRKMLIDNQFQEMWRTTFA